MTEETHPHTDSQPDRHRRSSIVFYFFPAAGRPLFLSPAPVVAFLVVVFAFIAGALFFADGVAFLLVAGALLFGDTDAFFGLAAVFLGLAALFVVVPPFLAAGTLCFFGAAAPAFFGAFVDTFAPFLGTTTFLARPKCFALCFSNSACFFSRALNGPPLPLPVFKNPTPIFPPFLDLVLAISLPAFSARASHDFTSSGALSAITAWSSSQTPFQPFHFTSRMSPSWPTMSEISQSCSPSLVTELSGPVSPAHSVLGLAAAEEDLVAGFVVDFSGFVLVALGDFGAGFDAVVGFGVVVLDLGFIFDSAAAAGTGVFSTRAPGVAEAARWKSASAVSIIELSPLGLRRLESLAPASLTGGESNSSYASANSRCEMTVRCGGGLVEFPVTAADMSATAWRMASI